MRIFITYLSGSVFRSEHGDERVPLTKHVISKGNTTTYEWKNGETPTRVEETQIDFHIEEDKPDDAEEGGDVRIG